MENKKILKLARKLAIADRKATGQVKTASYYIDTVAPQETEGHKLWLCEQLKLG